MLGYDVVGHRLEAALGAYSLDFMDRWHLGPTFHNAEMVDCLPDHLHVWSGPSSDRCVAGAFDSASVTLLAKITT